ncbi:8598_t:CDS:2 [Paraglomus brasilianum]|uniref:8598_t:CDS:1 n=1 Tax=Paraglomus brasilianum TaxID=144538 RepID=A0A9N9EXX3_9GLOM|nr:8598_t:CDS:2 [Paraglomus brasilianum]
MSFIKKLKNQYEVWKITKYTRRRSAMTPEFEQKDTGFYEKNYVNGVYLHTAAPRYSFSLFPFTRLMDITLFIN